MQNGMPSSATVPPNRFRPPRTALGASLMRPLHAAAGVVAAEGDDLRILPRNCAERLRGDAGGYGGCRPALPEGAAFPPCWPARALTSHPGWSISPDSSSEPAS